MHLCMDWRGGAFDWNRARAFLVAAEEGSFSAAARALGLAQPTLGRQVAALEEELGLTLFQRVGQRLTLTAAGLELAEQVRAMNDAATRASLVAAGTSQRVDGLVRVAASEAVAAFLLPPAVAELRAHHPGIEIELVVSNQTSDLRRREADVAVRHVRPRGDDLVGRLVAETCHAHLYASPAYLTQIGKPRTKDNLAARGHVLGFDEGDALRKGLAAVGLPFDAGAFPVRTANHLVQWDLAKRGVGMCVMMEEVGDREPAVRRALPGLAPVATYPTWITSHRELRTSRLIRVVFDVLGDLLDAAFAPARARRERKKSAKPRA